MIRKIKSMVILLCGFLFSITVPACFHLYSIEKAATTDSSSAAEQTTAPEEASPAGQNEEQPNPFAYTPPERECTRATLMAATESYIAAQEAGDPSMMSLAPGAKFKENMSEISKDKSLLNTALPIAHHLSIYDAGRCKSFTEVIVTEGNHQYVLGTRLTVDEGKITEVDTLVTDKDDWLFDAENYLKYSKAEDWSVLPPDDRVSRQDLIDAANQYFDFIFLDKGVRPPWGTPCARLEGGAYTNPDNEYKDTCRIPGPLGEMFVVNRTFLVDEKMGAVNIFCRFGESDDGMPDSHTFRLVNGKYRWIHTLSVNLTGEPVDLPEYIPDPDCKCDRTMLKDATESYIDAQEAGDVTKMQLADSVKFFENMSEVAKDEGLWNTPLPIAHHLSIYDTVRCKTFTEVIVTEGDHQYVLGTRLEVDNGKIKEIDSLVTDKDDWLFDAEGYLKYSKAEDWAVLQLDERISRQDLIDAANQYFDFVFMDKGIKPPWGNAPCARLEGGMYTNTENEEKDTCWIPDPLGELPVVNRTFLVDEEMGTVNVFCRFGDTRDGMPDSHTFRLVNGKYKWIHTLSVNLSEAPIEVPENSPGVPDSE